jgi:hypothetical protein
MTYREKLKKDHPYLVSEIYLGGCGCCPNTFYKNAKTLKGCEKEQDLNDATCRECWDQEAEDTE